MEHLDHAQVAGRIKFIMRKLKLNQAELAKALEITQPAVSKYLNERMPPVEIIFRLAFLGKVSMEWLLTGKPGPAARYVAEPLANYQTAAVSRDQISELPPQVQEALRILIDYLATRERPS